MNKTKLLTSLVFALLLLNLGILIFMFLNGQKTERGNKREHNPKEFIIHKLKFDLNQIVDYDKIITVHHETILKLDDSLKIYKNKLYSQLKTTENKPITDSLILKIIQFQTQIEHTHYNHFLDIKKICKPDQMEDYNQLTDELSKMFSNKPPKKERERED